MTVKNPTWNERFMSDVYAWSHKSKDPSTKIGAILVHWDEKDVFSHGYNGFVRGVEDDVPERWVRPEKYLWAEHGERNAIYNCARTGRAIKGSVMVTQSVPCADCCRAIIQTGVSKIILHQQWEDKIDGQFRDKWRESQRASLEMLTETGVEIEYFDQVLGICGMLNGKVIEV